MHDISPKPKGNNSHCKLDSWYINYILSPFITGSTNINADITTFKLQSEKKVNKVSINVNNTSIFVLKYLIYN